MFLPAFDTSLLCLVLLTCDSSVLSIPVDNGVVGDPEIHCAESTLSIIFLTQKAFQGHVYVKGRYEDAECRKDETGVAEALINIPFSSCGVRRTRSTDPVGVHVEVTVIISFHPQFVTKVDRAYAVRCFYMEADKTVQADLEVSMLTTEAKTASVPMPICLYEVLQAGPTGPPVRYARVGDPVFHKWSCTTESVDTFCMLVHSCKVDDGSGKTIDLLDENGCSVDKYLLGDLNYTTDLMAAKEAHVFKYADKPNLYFNCQIKLTVKDPGAVCERFACPVPSRVRRREALKPVTRTVILETLHDRNSSDEESTDVDVSSNAITVLDLDFGSDPDLSFLRKADDNSTVTGKPVLCLSVGAFSVCTIVSLGILLVSILVICSSWRRRTLKRESMRHLTSYKNFAKR